MNQSNPINFETVLEQLDRLLDSTPSATIRQSDRLVHVVYAKLQKYQRKSIRPFLDTIEKSQGKIEKYIAKNTAQQAVRSDLDWTEVDLRVHDMQLWDKKQNDKSKFRKGLAERSLALDFHDWEMQQFGESKLSKLLEDINSYKEKIDGNIQKFMTSRGIPAIDCVNRGIQHGTKLLYVEKELGTSSVSVVLFFAFAKFRDTVYPDLPQLVNSLRHHTWTGRFTTDNGGWFNACCKYYSEEISSRKRKHDLITMNEHVRFDKRIRGETQTLGQANDRRDEYDARMLPRQSDAPGCDSTPSAQMDSDDIVHRQISNRHGSSTAYCIPATSYTDQTTIALASPGNSSLHTLADVAHLARPRVEQTESRPTFDRIGRRKDCSAVAQAQTRSSTQDHTADKVGGRVEGNITRGKQVSTSCSAQGQPSSDFNHAFTATEGSTEVSASGEARSDFIGSDLNGHGMQPLIEANETEMTFGVDLTGWTRDANGHLAYTGYEGWLDFVDLGT